MVVRELINLIGFKVEKKDLDIAQKKFNEIKKTAKKISVGLLAVAGAVSGVALGVYKFTEQFVNTGDEIAKTSRDIGMSGEELQKWRYNADLAGISTEELNMNLRFFTKNLSDAAATGKGQMADSLRILGISITDNQGKMKNSNQILLEMADKLKGIQDPALRAKVATDVFGRSGIRMSQLLGQGSEELLKFMKEAEDLGLIINENVLSATEELNDNMTRLKSSFKGVVNIIGSALVPIVNKFVVSLTNLIKNMQQDFKEMIEGLATALLPVFDMVLSLIGTVFSLLGPVLKILANLLNIISQILKNSIIPFLDYLIKMLVPILSELAIGVGEILKALSPVIDIILNLIKIALTPLFMRLKMLFIFLSPIIKIISAIFTPVAWILSEITKIVEKLQEVFYQLFFEIIDKGVKWIMNLIPGIGDTFKNVFAGISKFFTDVINTIIDGINWLIEKTNSFAKTKLELIQRIDPTNILGGDVTKNTSTITNKKTDVKVTNNYNFNDPNSADSNKIKADTDSIAKNIFSLELKKVLRSANI